MRDWTNNGSLKEKSGTLLVGMRQQIHLNKTGLWNKPVSMDPKSNKRFMKTVKRNRETRSKIT